MEFTLQLLNAILPLQFISIHAFIFALYLVTENNFYGDLGKLNNKIFNMTGTSITILQCIVLSVFIVLFLDHNILDQYLLEIHLANIVLVTISYIITKFYKSNILKACITCNIYLYFSLSLSIILSSIISFIF